MKALAAISRAAAFATMGAALYGCSGWQSALDPAGGQAGASFRLIVGFTIFLGAVWAATMVALGLALRHRGRTIPPPLRPSAARERRIGRIVGALAIATGCVVLALTAVSFGAQRQTAAFDRAPVRLTVTGHQWWWEVRYDDDDPLRDFVTANEIHVPVGVPVQISLAAADVIHSFWIPNLTTKRDLVPGRDNVITIVADRAGLFRGQCAEFCGLQHAHMSLVVRAEDRTAFEAWRNAQTAPAATSDDPEAAHGRDVFLGGACALCHAVRGTPAGSGNGPDLTHVASRATIAAGILPITRGALAAWIADPQGIKPGAKMPAVPLSADELNAVAAYLESLR